MERATKQVEVKLLDGSKKQVKVYQFINYYDRKNVLDKFIHNATLKGNELYADVDISGLTLEIAKLLWADKETKLEDVDAESVDNIVSNSLGFFLGGLAGATAKA